VHSGFLCSFSDRNRCPRQSDTKRAVTPRHEAEEVRLRLQGVGASFKRKARVGVALHLIYVALFRISRNNNQKTFDNCVDLKVIAGLTRASRRDDLLIAKQFSWRR
jgi:hypothetical protein